jgi:hypothetical protein
MKPIRSLALIALLLTASAFAADQAAPGPRVLVVGDTLAGVPDRFRPEKGNPVYYVIAGKGEVALGDAIGRVEATDPALVEREVVKALASQGFVRTEVGGPLPSIALMIFWGTANFFTNEGQTWNAFQRRDKDLLIELLGLDHWPWALLKDERGNFVGVSMEQQAVLNLTADDRLYLSLLALDAAALKNKVRRKLWRTNMTIDSRHKLADVLPVMLASAAPVFGRGTKEPVFVDDQARRKAGVEIGDLKVVPDDATPGPAPAPKK